MGRDEQYTWTPPIAHSSNSLPPEVAVWLAGRACLTLATIEPTGQPQLSSMWAKVAGNLVLMATVVGRRKYQNLVRNPRATAMITNPDSQDHYVEIRGTVHINHEGGRELIDELHEHYRGTRPYPWDGPRDVRVVLALQPERVLVFN